MLLKVGVKSTQYKFSAHCTIFEHNMTELPAKEASMLNCHSHQTFSGSIRNRT